MRRVVVATLVAAFAILLVADRADARPVMGNSKLNGHQIAAWFRAHNPGPPCFTDGKGVKDVAHLFVKEGSIERVKGDIAFAQSIIETGWFRYGGAVECNDNNYAGIGATDSGGAPAEFSTPRIGVRAQVQHLRRYADKVQARHLNKPLVDPRFKLVKPAGKAPEWTMFGNGIWATDPNYSKKVLNLYKDMLEFNGI
jgi:hypothetical protein